MKTTMIILSLLCGSLAFAGNGSGTMGGSGKVIDNIKTDANEIVYQIGEKDGLIKFSYGLRDGEKWIVQEFQVEKASLATDLEISVALMESVRAKSWMPVLK